MKRAHFRALVDQALAELPREFLDRLENIAILIEDWPSMQELDEVGMDDRYGLLGVYLGLPLSERGSSYNMALPDRIILYQKNIEDSCATEHEVREQVKVTVAHEIAHHFGISDEDLERWGLG
ncbi:MAG: metallopeptidase family protein [Chloroflexi bacterium]|nr:metallopeptidase family protein [Chloroflexota bacterium]